MFCGFLYPGGLWISFIVYSSPLKLCLYLLMATLFVRLNCTHSFLNISEFSVNTEYQGKWKRTMNNIRNTRDTVSTHFLRRKKELKLLRTKENYRQTWICLEMGWNTALSTLHILSIQTIAKEKTKRYYNP